MPANAAVGDSLTYMLRQAHTVAIGNSSKVVMEDVTTLTTLGLNFYELDGDGGHIYRRINVTRPWVHDWQQCGWLSFYRRWHWADDS